jgi:hypothetical protein
VLLEAFGEDGAMPSRTRALCAAASLALALPGCAIRDHFTGEATAREIRAIGVLAEATVVQIWDTGVTVNHDPVVGFLLDVKPADGRPAFQAKTRALVSRLAVARVQPGATLRVTFDPHDTTRVALDPVR